MKPVWGGKLCNKANCYRRSVHYPGEYGCKDSEWWVCPKFESVDYSVCPRPGNGGNHWPGCGCPGDPKRNV